MTEQYPTLADKVEAVRNAVEHASNCPILWLNQSLEGRHREANQVWGELTPRTIERIGTDGIINADAGTAENPRVEVLVGRRRIRFQLNMRSRSYEHRNSAWYAAVLLEQRLRYPFINEKFLKPFCVGLESTGPVIEYPDTPPYDNRIEDVAVLEINVHTTLEDRDAAAVGTWIESTEITSNIKNAGGTSLDTSLQWDEEVIP